MQKIVGRSVWKFSSFDTKKFNPEVQEVQQIHAGYTQGDPHRDTSYSN